MSVVKGQFSSWAVGLKAATFESGLCAASHQQPEVMCAPGDLAEVSRLLARGGEITRGIGGVLGFS